MKIDVNKSTIYRFNRLSDLTKSVLLLGEKGYFSDYKNFFGYTYGTLTEVTVGCTAKNLCPFKRYGDESDTGVYSYFIPESKVVFEEEPKKYRPFIYLDELPFNLGDVVIYRGKQCCSECKGIVTEIEYQNNDDCELDNIIIGGINATPQELFDHYELLGDDCQYKPFGVEE